VRPRDVVGRTRRRLAAELIVELALIDKKIKAADRELLELIAATGSSLLDLHGIGPSGASRLLGDVGDISPFADRGRFASWNGTAPLDASSGDQKRHRLSRAGNRRINRVLHIMAIAQLRSDTEGRRYYRRKVAAGKTKMEAMRCLKRDCPTSSTTRCATTPAASRGRAREDTRGWLVNPAWPTHTPTSTLRISHFPDPPSPTLEPLLSLLVDVEGPPDKCVARNASSPSRAHAQPAAPTDQNWRPTLVSRGCRLTDSRLLAAFRDRRVELVPQSGQPGLGDLLAAHQLWSDWVRSGRVRKYAVIARKQ
jgi:hypothetical protein